MKYVFIVKNLWRLNDDQQFIDMNILTSSKNSFNSIVCIFWVRSKRWFFIVKDENFIVSFKHENAFCNSMFDKLANESFNATIIRNNWRLKSFFVRIQSLSSSNVFLLTVFYLKLAYLIFYDNLYHSFFIVTRYSKFIESRLNSFFLNVFLHFLKLRWLIIVVFSILIDE
jgi:hypothetical protein